MAMVGATASIIGTGVNLLAQQTGTALRVSMMAEPRGPGFPRLGEVMFTLETTRLGCFEGNRSTN
jgi:hypothetical protein